jgi:hypothetical protein
MLGVMTCRSKLTVAVHIHLKAVATCRLKVVVDHEEACCIHRVLLVQRLVIWP